jgi:hypothetical protein
MHVGCCDCATCAGLRVKVVSMIHEHGLKLNSFTNTPHHTFSAGINKLGGVTWFLGGSDLEPGL